MWEEGLMRKLRWALPLTVAACLMGAPAHADRLKEVVVVTHVDVDPQNVPIAEPLLTGFVVDSRDDPGVESFTLITQDPTTNTFSAIEVSGHARVVAMSAAETRLQCDHSRHSRARHDDALVESPRLSWLSRRALIRTRREVSADEDPFCCCSAGVAASTPHPGRLDR